ncbi:hypothetical protein O181_110576 [Austropuccinia psidii MF-1]|uniref:Uncharacterized protein n=1 Tax=Austropuccinia psidii MF-1 TaxID=1389203 RepID=A0A9Q3PRX3_9BASI|nr:hypothetical protein [Austropuccinia psidii MF-1]
MAHILHLSAHDGLKGLAKGPSTHEDQYIVNMGPMSISTLINPPDGLRLNYNSIISHISRLASYLCQSPQRREKFISMVNIFHEAQKGNTLLTNVITQWNSTYDMLERAYSLKDAYNQFCTPKNMEAYCI